MKLKNCKIGDVILGKATKKYYQITRVMSATIDVMCEGNNIKYHFCDPKLFRRPAKEVK